MSDNYDFTWSQVGKAGFTVLPQTKDTEKTSLVLTGRGSPNWGRDLQQNLLKMLEHFASPTPPANGVTGQLWYNTTTRVLHVFDSTATDPWGNTAGGGVSTGPAVPTGAKEGTLWYDTVNDVLKLFDGASWLQVFPVSNTVAQKIAFVTEYNAMAATLNKIIGSPQGTTLAAAFGYGQTDTFANETIASMTNAKWKTLLNKIVVVGNFLGADVSGVSTDGFIYEYGNTIPYGSVTMLSKYASTLSTLNALSVGTVRFKPAVASLESLTPAQGTAARSTTWSGTITHEVIATFADQNAMKAYLNAGGQFQFVSTETNAGTLRDQQWAAFLVDIGTVKFSATGSVDSANRTNAKGFYDLTAEYQQIYTRANPNNTVQVFTINAKIDASKAVHFQLVYSDPGTLYGGVGGTLTSSTVLVRAHQSALKAPVHAYPTMSQTALQ